MELIFEKTEKGYVAEFVAHSEYNLHLESSTFIEAVIYQKSISDGEYYPFIAIKNTTSVFDRDIHDSVFPKYVKIMTNCEMKNCYIKFSSSSTTDLSELERMIEQNRQSIQEQAEINAEQQTQINKNTEVNEAQEAHLEDMTPMSDDSLDEILNKIGD